MNLDIFTSGSSTYAYEDQLDMWMKKLSLMQTTIEKVLETQKLWLLLEPTFQNKSIQAILPNEFKKYKDHEKQY